MDPNSGPSSFPHHSPGSSEPASHAAARAAQGLGESPPRQRIADKVPPEARASIDAQDGGATPAASGDEEEAAPKDEDVTMHYVDDGPAGWPASIGILLHKLAGMLDGEACRMHTAIFDGTAPEAIPNAMSYANGAQDLPLVAVLAGSADPVVAVALRAVCMAAKEQGAALSEPNARAHTILSAALRLLDIDSRLRFFEMIGEDEVVMAYAPEEALAWWRSLDPAQDCEATEVDREAFLARPAGVHDENATMRDVVMGMLAAGESIPVQVATPYA